MSSKESTFTTDDPLGMERALETAGFRRDSKLGGILHPGKTSFREVSLKDSLHVVIDGNQVSAHVDRISPLQPRSEGSCRYSWTRILAHNISGMVDDVRRRVGGLHGKQRCELDCEVVWVDDGEVSGSGSGRPASSTPFSMRCWPVTSSSPRDTSTPSPRPKR